jgi:two-component system, cell cycle sensor histidine kinase and response regulator CckA
MAEKMTYERLEKRVVELENAEFERKRAEDTLYDRERYLQTLLQTMADGFWSVDIQGRLIEVNDSYCSMSGYDRRELLSKTVTDIDADETFEETTARIKRVKAKGSELFCARHRRKDGSVFPLEISITFMADHGGRFICLGRDLTMREEQRERIEILGRMLDEAPASITIHDNKGRFVYANRKTLDLHGYQDEEEFLAVNLKDLDVPESAALIPERFRKIAEDGEAKFEVAHYRKDGTTFPLEVLIKMIEWQGRPAMLSVATDITERKKAEEEKEKLHAQLIQAQKMESVGRLAGGVAHDINNTLGIILGHTDMALEYLDPDQPVESNLKEIRKAAKRSADLVRQLLAFARKQAILPKALDLNEAVEGMLKMIQRLIGENIHLVWQPAMDLWAVNMDASQVDQILANLCVNARDAIESVGEVTIKTGNVTLKGDDCNRSLGSTPGDYVVLAVSDDGCGMTKETLDKMFEPFFTTKEVGIGTGLGLSTIYGIVRQNKGFINVYSEPGHGTTFWIYIPRYTGELGKKKVPGLEGSLTGGQETILLVEDDPMLLKMIKAMVEGLGYRVLPAGSPAEAVTIAEEHKNDIALLITDVIMPQMNGLELANKLTATYPGLKCLFISGYPADVIGHHGVLDPEVKFIEKPFSMKDLANKIREALGN